MTLALPAKIQIKRLLRNYANSVWFDFGSVNRTLKFDRTIEPHRTSRFDRTRTRTSSVRLITKLITFPLPCNTATYPHPPKYYLTRTLLHSQTLLSHTHTKHSQSRYTPGPAALPYPISKHYHPNATPPQLPTLHTSEHSFTTPKHSFTTPKPAHLTLPRRTQPSTHPNTIHFHSLLEKLLASLHSKLIDMLIYRRTLAFVISTKIWQKRCCFAVN